MHRKLCCTLISGIVLVFLFAGCVPVNVYSRPVRNADFSKLNRFYIIQHDEDTKRLNEVVQSGFLELGLQATTGFSDQIPANIDAVVTYDYQWFWDLTTYLLMLKIYIRNPDTNFPYGMGESLRTSLVRKPPEEMVREILMPLFNPTVAAVNAK